jgi:hypothetical protein
MQEEVKFRFYRIFFLFIIKAAHTFSSPGEKDHVGYCHHFASIVGIGVLTLTL